ncbi:MAG TPA: AMP-binding protein, partial [Acidimicrobiales bacterium]|nr:AMP-binding protein [Acidimicrobiales bacterium]
GQPADIEPEHPTALAMFAAARDRSPGTDLVRYFGRSLTVAEVDRMTDALAAGLLHAGFRRGDRLAVYLQNVPQFALCMLATWKAGGTMVSINPMNKGKELRVLLDDSGATVLVCHPELYTEVAAEVLGGTAVELVLTTAAADLAADAGSKLLAGAGAGTPAGTTDLLELVRRFDGRVAPDPGLRADDTAFLTYTSGTTGPPKGAMTTHGNVVFNAQTYRDWVGLDSDDVVLGVAPLFHITGLIGHIAVCLLLPAPLVLAYRFEAAPMLEVIRRERPTFTVGSITVFIALMNAPGVQREDLSSLVKIYSGGAPIPPITVGEFERAFGHYIHNIYGLTETTSPSHAVPLGAEAPVDPASGALSVGVPVYSTVVRIQDEAGNDVAPGEVGELVTSGPQVVAGYWQKPEETDKALGGGCLRTGDVGYMDADGWFYIVDRKKDQINVAGYKVWPREVEDVLYTHPAVREAAVVGVPDEYRGETVKAFVSLRPGATADPEEIVTFCRERMAAYKYPRVVEVLDELPKTTTGKILRRELRPGPG